VAAFAERLFAMLLRASPRAFRSTYGAQMRRDFRDGLRDERETRGFTGAFVFAWSALADVLWSGLREYAAMIVRDFVFTARSMRKSPFFAVVIVATLALAIGANAAAFSILRAVVIAPLPYPQSNRLIAVGVTLDGFPTPVIPFADLDAVRTQNRSLRAFAGANDTTALLSYRGRVRRLTGVDATQGLFAVLALRPELGRFFTEADARRGSNPAIVLSDAFWRRNFGADPTIVGTQMRLDGVASTIVGIAPRGLEEPETTGDFTKADFWRILPLRASDPRQIWLLQGIARLRDVVTLTAAHADLQTIHARVATRYRKMALHIGGVRIEPLHDAVVGNARPFLFAIFAAVTGVLLIACANVTNLLLSRGATRDREFAIRVANGASRRRIFAQLLAESFVFAGLGGLCGLGLAYAAITGFVATGPELPRLDAITFDGSTALYTLLAVAFCTFAAGMAPAFALSSRQVASALKSAGRGGDASRGARVRGALIVLEIALTFALVVASSLVVRSFWVLTHEPLGFSPQNVVVTDSIEGSTVQTSNRRAFRSFYERLASRVGAIPGVHSVSLAFTAPFMGQTTELHFSLAGHSTPDAEKPQSEFAGVGPSYFALLQIPVLKGRSFSDKDRPGASEVVIVNQAFTRKYLPRSRVLGAQIISHLPMDEKGKSPLLTIVGIVGDVRENYSVTPQPTIYVPFAQAPPLPGIVLVRADPGVHVAEAVAAAVPATNALLPAPQMRDLTSYMSDDAARARLGATTLGALGLLGLLLAIAGIYAVVSYGVSQRTHELGVRMALGARARHIVQRVVTGALALTIIGVLCGIVVGAFAVRLVADQLYGVKPYDPLTFGIVMIMITLASIAAALIPARRATRVDPIIALRYE